MSNYFFYKNLPAIKSFIELSNEENYKEIPSDWYLIASDVKDSTKNIQEGKYKHINMVGAMTIVSILNLDRELDVPYIFGGDGAYLLVPRNIYKKVKQVLLAVKELSLQSYGLELRVAAIPIKTLYEMAKEVQIAKYELNNKFFQVLIKGDGLDYFEYLLKKDDTYHIKSKLEADFELDLGGLECRWNYVKSSKDESISLIFKCLDDKNYNKVLNDIENILGSLETRHPIVDKNLELSFDSKNLDVEASLFSKTSLKKQMVLLKLKFINLIGLFLMKFKIGEWKDYKKRIISTTDIQKFDNIVRMVFSSTFKISKELEDYLEREYQKGTLVYGLNKSQYALMTCLIFERHGRHIHFVDTSDGGYASAAIGYKNRLKTIE